jgi:hypothetical protein
MFSATARRTYYTMASPATTAPYTKAVVAAMRKLYVELPNGQTGGRPYLTLSQDIQKFWLTRVSTTLGVRIVLPISQRTSTDLASVLLEAPFDPLRRQMNSVLLTVDLTKAVVDEAIARQDSIVVAYRA